MSNIIEYKGYHGSIEFDSEDNILFGSVIGICDSLNYHGSSVSEITQSFHDCVDGYLEMCAELGRNPDREYKGSFNVRIPSELHRTIDLEAKKSGISLNQYVQEAIEAKAFSKSSPVTSIIFDGVQLGKVVDATHNNGRYKEPVPIGHVWEEETQ